MQQKIGQHLPLKPSNRKLGSRTLGSIFPISDQAKNWQHFAFEPSNRKLDDRQCCLRARAPLRAMLSKGVISGASGTVSPLGHQTENWAAFPLQSIKQEIGQHLPLKPSNKTIGSISPLNHQSITLNDRQRCLQPRHPCEQCSAKG